MKITIQDGDSVQPDEAPGMAKENATRPAGDDAPVKTSRKKTRLDKKELSKNKKDELHTLREIVENLTDELKNCETELVEAEDRAMRAVADADNFKKRLAREAEERARFAEVALLEAILPVMDILEKARDTVEEGAGDLPQLQEGVKLTCQRFHDILEKRGIERLDVVGKPFDPVTSEALLVESTPDHEDGAVVREFVPGYRYRGRMIRPAKVAVAKNQLVEEEPASSDEEHASD